LTDEAQVVTRTGIQIVDHQHFSTDKLELPQIFGGDSIEEATKIFMDVLNNECTAAQRNVVLANSSMAIHTFDNNKSIADCWAEAEESLVSKKALKGFKNLVALSA